MLLQIIYSTKYVFNILILEGGCETPGWTVLTQITDGDELSRYFGAELSIAVKRLAIADSWTRNIMTVDLQLKQYQLHTAAHAMPSAL